MFWSTKSSVAVPAAFMLLGSVNAQTPIMGYNSYNDVACSPNETMIHNTIQSMSDKGFLGKGYKFFQIDCGWQGFNRLSNGSITYDSSRFPNGISPLSKFAISLGFKWSMYTDQGVYSCDTNYNPHRPGSLGYETQDAAMFAAWNTAYVKVDNCFVDPNNNAPKDPRTDFPSRYATMWNALKNVGIPNMLICQWGVPYQNTATNTLQGPTAWAPAVSTSFRISDDIAQGWSQTLRIYNQAIHAALKNLVGPNKFADMDLLEVGNPGMTVDEQKTHFAVWAAFKSALMISTPVPSMSAQTAAILGNQDLIAVNQDALGLPVKLVQRFSNNYDIFLGPLADGSKVLLIVDHSNTARTISVPLSAVGINSASARDLWAGSNLGTVTSVSQNVPAHGSMVYRLSAIQSASTTTPTYQTIEAEAGTLANGAAIANCAGCSGGKKVGNLLDGSTASLTFTGVKASQGTVDVLFDYINCEVQYLGSSVPNVRTASISVNGGAGVTVLFPLSGYDWYGDVLPAYKVRLSGFTSGSSNTIKIQSLSGQGNAPDIDRIQVPQ
ncbi:hypothetical protein ONS95_010716 [Cadophora gregata]|uniref:uncharacterized protein n=1 Tax=Cadophora gregata TaxID=51156 RepID=UPI0026DBF4F3|nr:uncharacterized protein ONS95_010716 [Cadophora gregata]KAK0122485.1 hypothetical protein ONS95_010716 [Cadophora gregata]KAK0127962.1 hypothetical protein ONS96_007459 [Cadophora gregata f. sp. sojae]